MRQVFLDTETTGLSADNGDRIIEIGCVEMLHRKLTGNNRHFYVNPERDSDEGLCWFYLGSSQLRLGNCAEALRCGYRATRCPGTVAIGFDLAGRAAMRMGEKSP